MAVVLIIVLMVSVFCPITAVAEERETSITILGTSDVHGRIFPWDYALDAEAVDTGYLKIESVIKQVRKENKNVILVDAGDVIQDNSIELFQNEEKNPIIEVMNILGYDTWTLGNHEFNFGLEVLDKAVKTSNATVLAGNIYNENGERAYSAYKIVEKDGVKVAIIGMITPNIPRWEASMPDHFKGLIFKNPVDETKKVMTELEGKADLFVGVFHMGLDNEYTSYDGARSIIEANPQLDVAIVGHAHSDISGEMIGNTLVVEPKAYGNRVSKIDLKLSNKEGKWYISEKKSENIDTKNYDVDPDLVEKWKHIHDVSREDANTIIGTVTKDFIEEVYILPGIPKAQVEDTALIDFINEVQMYYTKADVSAAAAFKEDMNLLKGEFKKKDVANIYKYANTLIGVKVTAKQLKDYMEWSAKYFNTYKDGDVTISFNKDIRGYNYDMFSGIDYDIDISKPEGQKIVNLKFKGKPVTDEMTFTLAVNNYRFGNMVKDGYFKEEDKVFDSSEKWADGSIRALIGQYVQEKKEITPKCDQNWKIIGIHLNHPLKNEVYDLVKSGKIKIPMSEDGRTPNVASLNIYELQKQGLISSKTQKIIKHQIDQNITSINGEKTYTVKQGDVLWRIGKKFDIDWKKIAQINQLKNSDLIYPNQVIKIPAL